MRASRVFSTAVVAITAFGLMATTGTATASPRITKGDAEAVLRAFGSGGLAVLNHNRVMEAGPSNLSAQLSPLNLEGCVLDWHAFRVADIEGSSSNEFAQKSAAATISQLSLSIEVDGAPLQLTQTPVARLLEPQTFDPSWVAGYYSQWGALVSPGALSVGSHAERIIETVAGVGTVIDVTFPIAIDPAGEGSCKG